MGVGNKRKQHPARKAFPLFLPPNVRAAAGIDQEELLRALESPSPTSIRLNPAKPITIPSFLDHGEPVPWCYHGRYLAERPVFTLDPLLHAGAYYVQEASSMLLEQAVRACGELPTEAVALDLCSAPGGKATHLASLLPEEALLICNEPVRPRRTVLLENLWKWGRSNTVVTGSLPQAFVPCGAFCDLVVVDAPCSGEGMFRKDPFAREQWNDRLVETCSAQQHTILDAAWTILLPGGHLIYSTCTWEPRENEDQVQRLISAGAEFIPIKVDPQWGVLGTGSGYRCYPHKVQGEGFFIAVLRKPGARSPQALSEGNEEQGLAPLATWLKNGSAMRSIEKEGVQHALHARWSPLMRSLSAHVHVSAPGVPVAFIKGGEWRPHPALALNTSLSPTAFQALDLSAADALRYLRGAALPADAAEGPALVRYAGLGLGWASGAGRRWNNGWPGPWRIRMR